MKINVLFNVKAIFILPVLILSLIICLVHTQNVQEANSHSTKVLTENTSKSDSEEDIKTNKDDNNLINSDSVIEPSATNVDSNLIENKDNLESFNKPVFAEAAQNSGVHNEIVNSGQPVVINLEDTATAELQQRANIPSVLPSQNEDKPSTDNRSNLTEPKLESSKITIENVTSSSDQQEIRSEPNTVQTEDLVIDVPIATKANLTEEIPSFSEWTQKRLAEAEKKGEQILNTSSKSQSVNGNKPGSGAKLRWKNYASLDCGAKIVAANPEAGSPSAVLSPSRDEYKLNTCTSRIWFIVELCEAIQAKKIDLANFELFSSSPKDFTVSVSDRFPSRDWSNVGQFTAKDERDVQSFDLHPQLFGKYIKVEIKSHYGSEHFCPISLFRVYGTSEFEVLQKEDTVHEGNLEEEDDDDDELDIDNGSAPKNLFSSATDAVISIVKKAAEVLGNKANNTNQTSSQEVEKKVSRSTPLIVTCTSPRHLVVCDNCSDTLFGQVFELLSCRRTQIKNIVSIPLISKSLYNSNICKNYGLNIKSKFNKTLNSYHLSVQSFFPKQYLAAMCNVLAVVENKIVLNISSQYPNVTSNESSEDKIINIETSEPHVIKPEITKINTEEKLEDLQPTDELNVEVTEIQMSKSSCSTDISYTSQIKPTKAFTSDININKEASTVISAETDHDVVSETINSKPQVSEEKSTEKLVEVLNTTKDGSVDNNESASNVGTTTTSGADSTEGIEDHLDNFISDFNSDNSHTSNQVTTSTPQVQKESVFLRLSNRIKALERNMSLSSQYLEELSRRYKKQVEEMQKLFDKTLTALKEESKKKDEEKKELEEKLNALTSAVETLIADKNSWWFVTQWSIILVVAFCIFTLCGRWTSRYKHSMEERGENKVIEIQRRKSIDVITPETPKKTRRPSDQALKIVRSAMLAESNKEHEIISLKERKKRKKKPGYKVSSTNTLSEEQFFSPELNMEYDQFKTCSKIWNRQESAPPKLLTSTWLEDVNNKIEEMPFVLDESEHSALDLPIANDTEERKITPPPIFIKTATTSRLNRTASQNGPIQANGDHLKVEIPRKSASLDETHARVSPAPSINGSTSLASSIEEPKTPKKERKGIKKLFKKVF